MFYIKDRNELDRMLLGGHFGEFRFEIQKRFWAITLVLDDTEIILKERKDDLENRYKEELSQVDFTQDEYPSDYASLIMEEEGEVRYVMVYYALYNSTFMMAQSLFEAGLRLLFTHLQDAKGIKEKVKPKWRLKSVIADFKSVLGLDLQALPEWKTIEAYIDIRNAIAHNNGYIVLEDDEKLEENKTYKSYLHLKQNLVLFKPEPHFRIGNKEFIHEFVRSIYQFFNEMEEPIKNEIGNYKVEQEKWFKQFNTLNNQK